MRPSASAPSGPLRTGLSLPWPISVEHADAVAGLEWHHRDPFDCLLIAQATIEQAVLVTNDPALQAYGTPLIW